MTTSRRTEPRHSGRWPLAAVGRFHRDEGGQAMFVVLMFIEAFSD